MVLVNTTCFVLVMLAVSVTSSYTIDRNPVDKQDTKSAKVGVIGPDTEDSHSEVTKKDVNVKPDGYLTILASTTRRTDAPVLEKPRRMREKRSIYGFLNFLGYGKEIRAFVKKVQKVCKIIVYVILGIVSFAVIFGIFYLGSVFLRTFKDSIQICFMTYRMCMMWCKSCCDCYDYYCATLVAGYKCDDCQQAFCSYECCDKRPDRKGDKPKVPRMMPREHMERYGPAGRYIQPKYVVHPETQAPEAYKPPPPNQA
eukprot:TRINITY_DN510_c0_g1_i10.p1 TRINITY_DN510_c0_g1~~TRINITY_DN510_c0_g1_i10.p1  ORF type:complete len:255 (-),score=22.89 TRINITY_DN510_c0_g1_i10:240-1004(-)